MPMRRLPSIAALPLSTALVLTTGVLAGCNVFSRYGPAPQAVMPPPTVVAPVPGTIELPPAAVPGVLAPGVGTATIVAPGGATLVPPGADPGLIASTVTPQAAVIVPAVNHDFVWDQIVDVVDDYFEIEQEERLKVIGDIPTEGNIYTFPLTGATLMEPWRRDSVNFYERLESTLQSIRRRATVRVIPDRNGYLVDVNVWKELEDVKRPIKASAGAATFRYDTSLTRDSEFDPDPNRIPGDPARPNSPRTPTLGWIYLGPDLALQQEMLAKIQARLGGMVTPVSGAYVVPGTPAAGIPTPAILPPAGAPIPGTPNPAPAPQFIAPAALLPPGSAVPQQLPPP